MERATQRQELTAAFSPAFEDSMDRAQQAIGQFDMSAIIYDFAPVPFSPEGTVITPTVFAARNMPTDMAGLWFDGGLYHSDPVQRLALKAVRPLFWSYHFEEQSVLNGQAEGSVADYLRDCGRSRGITVPIHTIRNGVATVTGVWSDEDGRNAQLDADIVARFMLLAYQLHETLIETFDATDLLTTAVRLTPRERECIALCATGLSDKQVAFELDRSISTVVMHMQSAFRKLGARNRAQAIARAAYYGLLH